MKIDVVSLFPELVEQVAHFGMVRRAVDCGALTLVTTNLRNYAQRFDRRVDDRTYGGGPGMVLQPEPVIRAVEAARAASSEALAILLSPQGERLNQAWLERLAAEQSLVLVCGRYEGVDERVVAAVDLELSLGDFVLSGGELAAMAVVDGVARLQPGVLGDGTSAQNDSFTDGLLDYPHFTRPQCWRGAAVPEVLVSGDHEAIRRWRLQQALGITWLKRPDLLMNVELDEEQVGLLQTFIAQSGRKINEVDHEQDH